METNFVILIPSRIGSTRLRKKPLIDINGMSLIERVYKNSIAISNNSYIATDSDEILNHAQTFTKNVISTNNKHISGTDRIFEAAKKLKIDDETLIINLQGDEPFMPIDLVNQLINDFNNNKCDVISACHPIKDLNDLENPNCVKVHYDNKNYAKTFQRKPINKEVLLILDIFNNSFITISLFFSSRFPVGSSAIIISGEFAIALDIAILCCSPPDKLEGLCLALCSIFTSFNKSIALSLA